MTPGFVRFLVLGAQVLLWSYLLSMMAADRPIASAASFSWDLPVAKQNRFAAAGAEACARSAAADDDGVAVWKFYVLTHDRGSPSVVISSP